MMSIRVFLAFQVYVLFILPYIEVDISLKVFSKNQINPPNPSHLYMQRWVSQLLILYRYFSIFLV